MNATTGSAREIRAARVYDAPVALVRNAFTVDAQTSVFVAERTGMTQGWTGSFDKLERILCTQAQSA